MEALVNRCALPLRCHTVAGGNATQQAFSGRRLKVSPTRCAARGEGGGSKVYENGDYYEVLGVAADASSADIRKAYRQLQKKYHPDVAGQQGHHTTLLLNEAYATLMDGVGRAAYDVATHAHMRGPGHTSSFTGVPYSTWNGPDRPQGIFVDENACVGCRECVFKASNTFAIDELLGSARVKTQWGDSEARIKMAIDACPVNCIHYVEREDLPVLEHVMSPQPRPSHGVYGGGWERPSNVFMAARAFKRRMKDDANAALHGFAAGRETAAQKKARMEADSRLRTGAFWSWLWSWAPRQRHSSKGSTTSSWKKMFGRASTSLLWSIPVSSRDVAKVTAVVQEWALTFASSSELPLPMPFRADVLSNGVQLHLVTLETDVLSTIGVLAITVEEQASTDNDEDVVAQDLYVLCARRQGVTSSKALPGERRILQLLKDALAGRDTSYSTYSIPR